MNYEISEDRLNKLVDKVMEKSIGKLSKSEEDTYVSNATTKQTYYNMLGEPMVIILERNGDHMAGLNHYVYKKINNVFGYDDNKRTQFSLIQNLLKNWYKRKFGIKVLAVETFNPNEEGYFY